MLNINFTPRNPLSWPIFSQSTFSSARRLTETDGSLFCAYILPTAQVPEDTGRNGFSCDLMVPDAVRAFLLFSESLRSFLPRRTQNEH